MTTNSPDAPKQELKQALNGSIVIGVLLVLLGLGAIAFPGFTTLAAESWVGWFLIFGGVSNLIYAVQSRAEGGFVWKLLLGVLYVLTGLFLLANPLSGVLTLTLLLASFLFLEGLFEILFAVQMRQRPNWLWLLGNGVVTLILGVLIWAQFPISGTFAIGLLLGFSILSTGVSRIMLSVAARQGLESQV